MSGSYYGYSTCTSIGGSRVKLVFTSSNATEMRQLCGVSIFGTDCTTETPVVTEGAWGLATTTFDLLQDTSKLINLPTATATPTGCFSVTWNAYRQSDAVDMEVDSPTVYSIPTGAIDLYLSHTVSDYAARLALFSGPVNYYFEGTFSDSVPTMTSQFTFQIEFTDACRTATINSQVIADASAEWNTETSK